MNVIPAIKPLDFFQLLTMQSNTNDFKTCGKNAK